MLYALGIPGVGYVNAESLAEHFGTIDDPPRAQPEEIEHAEASARSSPSRSTRSSPRSGPGMIERLRAGLRMELDPSERRKEGGPLDGKTLVLTGTLPNLSASRRPS